MGFTKVVTSLKNRIISNAHLSNGIKNKLISIDLESNDIIYLCYPYLFNDVFKVNEDVVEDVSLAGYYYYNSLIVLDRISDGNTEKEYLIPNLNKLLYCFTRQEKQY